VEQPSEALHEASAGRDAEQDSRYISFRVGSCARRAPMGSGEIVTLTRCGGSSKEGWSSSGMRGSLPGHGCATVKPATWGNRACAQLICSGVTTSL
jgi:hypothetical protein